MKRTTASGLTAGGALISGATLFYSEGGSSQAPAGAYSITLEASPRMVDEGDLVDYAVTARATPSRSRPASRIAGGAGWPAP